MRYGHVHGFDGLDTARMRELQNALRGRIMTQRLEAEPKVASGVDLAYDGNRAICVMVTLDINSRELLEEVHAVAEVTMPYVPGYLAFRELPPFLNAWERARVEPDIVFFDAQGQMHPRRMGMATHASFFLHRQTDCRHREVAAARQLRGARKRSGGGEPRLRRRGGHRHGAAFTGGCQPHLRLGRQQDNAGGGRSADDALRDRQKPYPAHHGPGGQTDEGA